ncbi:MAG: caspase family protein [Bacteroidales bacterium]|nr:caspase family protein [Bacteroidales bacterium]
MRILSTILALLLPFTLLAQVKEVVLLEDFADNSTDWPEDDTDIFSASVNDGTYYLSHKRNGGSKVFDIPLNMYLGDNYYIETVGKLRTSTPGGGYGIVWGKGGGGYFSFAITASGKCFVRHMVTGTSGSYLIEPMRCDHIRKGVGATNKLRVQYSNDEIEFFVNDKYVGHVPRELYYGNNAGIIIYGRQDVDITTYRACGTKNYKTIENYHGVMRVMSYEIEDGEDVNGERLGNGDCRISPGETVKLAVKLKNHGYGSCNGLRVIFYAVSGNVTVIDQDVEQHLDDMDHFDTQVFDLKFKVSPSCRAEQISFKLDILDTLDRLAESVPMRVMLNMPIPPINKKANNNLSLTFSLYEANYDDINSSFPLTLNNGNQTYAVIVGVESYHRLPKAKYATNDARIFYKYLLKVLNIPSSNIIYALNQKATLKDVVDIFKVGGLLQYKVYDKSGVDLIVYFSGLGLCDISGTVPYMMLYDSDANNPSETGYALPDLLRSLRGLRVHSLTCFFETSFAGVDRDGRPFGRESGVVKANACFPSVTDNNTCLMYASGGVYVNPVVDNTSHGMFTHYLISSLNKYAKARTTLDVKHLYDYIYQSMSQEAVSRSIELYPRIDCNNLDGIRLLK